MSEYTPTEEDFIRVYGVDGIGVENQANINRARRGIAKLKADALREVADYLYGGTPDIPCTQGSVNRSIRVHADRIEREA